MPVPAWLRALSQQQAASTPSPSRSTATGSNLSGTNTSGFGGYTPTLTQTPTAVAPVSNYRSAGPRGRSAARTQTPATTTRTSGTPGRAAAATTAAPSGTVEGATEQKMSTTEAQRQLMSGSPTDPKTWAAYQQVYGKPHSQSPEGQAAVAAGTQGQQAALANQQPYTNFQASPGTANYYPGREAINAAAAANNMDFQGLLNNPNAQYELEYGFNQAIQDAGATKDVLGQPYSTSQFLTDPSGEWLGKQLGMEFSPSYVSGGGPMGGIPQGGFFTGPGGEQLNAGIVGQWFQDAQENYRRQLQNIEQNYAQNPNIVGTGFMTTPLDPIEALKHRLAGTQPTNQIPASQINDMISRGVNAYGDPLGQGGPNAPFSNAPIGSNNQIDQSTQPGTQTAVPPAGSPFAPQGPQPGAGPSGTSFPGAGLSDGGGYTNWTGGMGGYTPQMSTPSPGSGANETIGGQGFAGTFGQGMGMGGWTPPPIDNPYNQYQTGVSAGMGGGWSPPSGGSPFPNYTGPGGQQLNPTNFYGGTQLPQGNNPWQNLGTPGGGMASLGDLLMGIQSLRGGGYGMQGGWNPMTGFGGAIGTPSNGGIMSFFQNRPPALPMGSLNNNYYNVI